MKMKVVKLEHAALRIEHAGKRIAIDPGSMTSASSGAMLRGVDAVLITHKHGDHFAPAILHEIGAHIYGPAEVVDLAKAAGLAATALECGGVATIGGLVVTAVSANHGPEVRGPLDNFGFVIGAGDCQLYVTSDLAGPQQKLPLGPFALIAIPVEGGGFVFDGQEAAEFLKEIGHSGLALPVHADDAPDMRFKFTQAAALFCKPVELGIGGAIEVQGGTHV